MENTSSREREDESHWAFELLREKGHSVGDAILDADRSIKTHVDGILMKPGDAIRMAAKYPEWIERHRRWLEYVNSLQNR